jgi:acyl dehydratase
MSGGRGEVRIGDELPPLARALTQEQIGAYAEASGDRNPIHLDADFARSVGLPGTIAHGLLDMAILAEAVARWAGAYERVAALSCRFSKPLLPGETITCSGRVVAVDPDDRTATLQLEAVSSRGERVLTNGRAVVRLEA